MRHTATPGDSEGCRGSPAGMKMLVKVEMEVTFRPPLPHPTIAYRSIHSPPSSFPPILYFEAAGLACLPSSSSLRGSLYSLHISCNPMGANEALILAGGSRVEIRVSFIILYKLPSRLPGTNSEGNRKANSPDHIYYRHQ